jgi:hypothetical protein
LVSKTLCLIGSSNGARAQLSSAISKKLSTTGRAGALTLKTDFLGSLMNGSFGEVMAYRIQYGYSSRMNSRKGVAQDKCFRQAAPAGLRRGEQTTGTKMTR